MPDWLIDLLRQFPVVALAGFVAWYAYRKLERNSERHQTRERELHADALARLGEANERLLAARDAEVARLSKELKAELRKLTRAVEELAERMKP